MTVVPADHSLAKKERVTPQDLEGQPFMLLEHGGKTEVSELLEKHHVKPDIRFTTWNRNSAKADPPTRSLSD